MTTVVGSAKPTRPVHQAIARVGAFLEDIGLIAWVDKDGDGRGLRARGGVRGQAFFAPDEARGDHGERVLVNEPTDAKNEPVCGP